MLLIFAVVFLLRRYGTYAVPLSALSTEPSGTFPTYDAHIFARDDSTLPCSGHRTVLDILWSCLATTFACTWVSVHPNLPWKGEGKWTILSRRIYLMFFSIFAPEFMVVWAFKQWRGARMIRQVVNDSIKKAYSGREHQMPKSWTTAHGHLLQMGGFRLCATARENFFWGGSIDIGQRGDFPEDVEEQHHPRTYISAIRRQCESIKAPPGSYAYASARRAILGIVIKESDFYKREASNEQGITQSYEFDGKDEIESDELIWEGVLRSKTLQHLLAEGLIQLPTITADEINDRSKGDVVSKGLALLQLTWFVVQILTRAARGLAISELELTTAALAGMNSVMYFFWWSKPRDVRFPVVVQTKGVERLLAGRPVDDVKWEFSYDEFDFREHLWASVEEACSFIVSFPFRVISTFLKLYQGIEAVRRISGFLSSVADFLKSLRGKAQGTGHVTPAVPLTEDPGTFVEDPDVQEGQHEPSARKARKMSVSGLLYQSQRFAQKLKSVAMSSLKYAALPFFLVVDLALLIPISQILGDDDNYSLTDLLDSELDSESKCETFRMIFYSEGARKMPLFATSSVAGALFGAVHCLAWHFSFPTHAEQIMWRSASVGVVGSCVWTLTTVIIWPILDKLPDIISGLTLFIPTGMILFVYPIARIALLVLAVTSLRSLPTSTLDTIDWVELFPHI